MLPYVDYLPTITEAENENELRQQDNSCVRQKRINKNNALLIISIICLSGLLSGMIIYRNKILANEPNTMMYLKSSSKKRNQESCGDDYSKKTLKSLVDLPFAATFADTKGEKKWEASEVTIVNGSYYVIHDNSWAVSKIDPHFLMNSEKNIQYGDPVIAPTNLQYQAEDLDSSFEAIVEIDQDTFYLIRESIHHKEEDVYRAVILKVKLPNVDHILQECPSEKTFDGTSKGFEGAASLIGADGTFFLLGMCEGNYCSEGDRGKKPGHGQIIVMSLEETDQNDYGCQWKTVTTLHLPHNAYFTDYSSLTIQENRIAVSSQEDSKLWIGKISLDNHGYFDPFSTAFTPGHVLQFPRDTNCEIIYCNIEGIHWVSDEILVAVSDKMKSKGKQHYRCLEKDQSIHLFVVP
mmetsp:Transcript_10712/g.14823  ORF Transcript_10712/g.14823 Transcript_10712/m.14823 type:complete len:407 (-) Transcript_10712:277-1497(-)